MNALVAIARSVGGLAMFASALLVAHAMASRAVRDSLPARIAATCVCSALLLIGVFALLSVAHLFRFPLVLVVLIGAAAWLRPLAEIRIDLADGVRQLKQLPRLSKALLGGASGLVAIKTARGLFAPPLAWDALTYHLPRAADWIQAGGWHAPAPAPDAWGYYGHFPPWGDALWAWAMLPWSSAACVALAGAAIWTSTFLIGVALARELGTSRERSMRVALAIALMPAVEGYVTSAYVDPAFLALMLGGTLFVLRARRQPGEAWIAAAAFVLADGVRHHPIALVGFALAIFRALAARTEQRPLAAKLIAIGLLGALPFLAESVWTGSPLSPLSFHLGPLTFPGNAQLAWVLAPHETSPFSWKQLLFAAFWKPDDGDPVGLGAVVLLAPLGMSALARDLRLRLWRGIAGTLLLIVGIATLLAPSVHELWAGFVFRSMRLATFPVALTTAWAGTLPGRATDSAFAAVVLLELSFDVPWSFTRLDWLAVAVVAVIVAFAFAVYRLSPQPFVAGLVSAFMIAALIPLRAATRRTFFADAVSGREHDVHELNEDYANAWPLWIALDQDAPLRIAVTAGWDGVGQNAFLFPLHGSALQNRIEYVPVTASGEVLDTWPPSQLRSHADERVWLERIQQRHIDFLVTLAPAPLEARWATAHPERFERLPIPAGESAAWRVKK